MAYTEPAKREHMLSKQAAPTQIAAQIRKTIEIPNI